MSEFIKLGDTVRFDANISHPVSGYAVNADSGVRYYVFKNDSDSVISQGDMIARSGYVGSYRGSFSLSVPTYSSGDYVLVKASGRVTGLTGWGNVKEFIVDTVCNANLIRVSGQDVLLNDFSKNVWNYGGSVPYSRSVDIQLIANNVQAATAFGAFWECAQDHYGFCRGGSSNTIILDSGDTYATDNIASGCKIKLLAGTGEGQFRRIIGYNASSKTATISENWITNPVSGNTQYIIYDGESQDLNTVSVYYANIKYNRLNTPTPTFTDTISVQWYKDGSIVTSGNLTNPRISLYNTTNGQALISHQSMTYSSPVLGSVYYQTNSSLMSSGVPYMVAISGTIDGSMRAWNQIIGLDLL